MGVSNRLSAAYPIALAVVLAVLAGPAAALGLGQIVVKSRPGQPLLAEIPVISSDPAELDQLQARLASPETFRRVGLEPPTGAASDLQFAVGLDARGHSVIRVTSATPIQQPLLTFLVEVDWGEGRLVREYSALVDAPRTVAAPMQAPIQAPVVAPSNIIVRPIQAPVAATPTPTPRPVQSSAPRSPAPAPAPKPVPAPRAAPAPAATPAPVARTSAVPSPAPSPPAAAVVPHASQPAEYGPVRRGQTLSQIAGRLDAASAYTLDQTMLALLRANPEAFIGDDINRLKQGAVLRMPAASELSRYSATQAAAVVREQMANWRQAQRPTLQPAATATAAVTSAAGARPASRGNKAAPQVADARLEIVPPSSSNGRRAGTRSGIDAGGEGDMLRQQLQQSNETLAARTAEVQELKTRVAELEKLQQQQQQLLAMKDSALAAAQQNLAKTNRPAAAAAVPAATAQAQQPTSATPDHADRGTSIWVGTGAALIAAALLAWWLASRRRTTPTSVRRFDTAALAASIPIADATGLDAVDEADAQFVAAHSDAGAMTESGAIAATTSQDPVTATPTWHAGATATPAPEPAVADVANASQQLELARAYLDLGDDNAARELLREVMDGRDPAARSEAARLLRDL